jgi:CRP/FNR family cyclic AMP-dependent transcriptional regulator
MSDERDPRTTDAPPVTRLKEIGLFGGLSEDTLTELTNSLETRLVQPGEMVFREGDRGRELFIVLEGEMEVLKRSKRDRETRVAVLGPSDWFGEMAVLDIMPRSASVRALAPTRLLRFGNADLDALYRRDLKAYALIVLNIAREISRRLRVADGILAEMVANVMDEYLERR